MGDVINLVQWLTEKTDAMAQRYNKCVGTCSEAELKDELKALGFKLAHYKTFQMRKEKELETTIRPNPVSGEGC